MGIIPFNIAKKYLPQRHKGTPVKFAALFSSKNLTPVLSAGATGQAGQAKTRT